MKWKLSKQHRFVRLTVCLLMGVLFTGLIVSWFVAGALVAPAHSVIGDAPADLPVTLIELASESGSIIRGWHLRVEKSKGVIVLLHGIRASRLAMISRARLLKELGYSTLLVDLQAHGESSGENITVGHLEQHDARAAVEFVRSQHPNEPIGLIGVSLGGAAAVLGSPLNIDAMVLESVYPDIGQAIHNRVAARLGWLSPLPVALLKTQLRWRLGISPTQLQPIKQIAATDCPVYLISGTLDKHTTAKETESMFSAARDPKELWLVEGAEHEDLLEYSSNEYGKRIGQFLAKHLSNSSR